MNIAQALNLKGEIDSYERQEAAWLLEHIVAMNALELKLSPEQELTELQQQAYLKGLQRIEQGEPLAYITGSQPFWTLDLKVTHDTLVPRPDTEILVETVLKLKLDQKANVVDLGTGTGAIALALACERPEWQITATDIFQPTLDVAQENAIRNGLTRVQFCCGVWFEALAAQQFDVIVSNPPYIDAEDAHMQKLKSEPERALVADAHGLADIKTIIAQAKDWLKPNGWVMLEHGYDQGQAVRDIFAQHGFIKIQTIQDYAGNDRVSIALFE